MSLTFGLSLWWLIPAFLAAGGVTYWTYRETQPSIPTTRRAILAGLRFLALAIIILLLLEPILRQIEENRRPPLLGVLMDASESVTVRADTTVDARAQLRDLLRNVSGTSIDGEKAFYTFGSQVQAIDEAAFDTLAFDEPRTNISEALRQLQQEYGDQNLKSVLLLSDGQFNTGRNPIYQAGESPVPIHTVVLGDTARPVDLQVRQVQTNDIAYLDRQLPVEVHLRNRGFSGQNVSVEISRQGTELATETITLGDEQSEQSLQLTITPQEAGLQQYQVSVTELQGEQTYENNRATVAVRVLEHRRRVLLVGGAPTPTLSAVHQTLTNQTDNEITRRTQKSAGTFYEGDLPSDLSSFDVILLVGNPGPASQAGQVQQITTAVQEQPVVFVFDRQTDLQLLRQTLGNALPAQPTTIRSGIKPVLWSTTPQGQTHPILDVSDDAPSWQNLPPLQYSQSTWQPSPDSRVLATIQEQGVTLDDPLLAIRQRSGQRSAVLLGGGLYRWHNLPEADQEREEIWPALLSNLIQWVTTRQNDQPLRVSPTQTVFDSREPVEFTGEVYDESMNPVDDASVELTVTAPDQTTYPYPMRAAGNGQYELSVGTLPAGNYQYRAVARRDTQQLGTDQGTFAVGSVGIEYLNTSANPTLMRQIALRSGGSFIDPDSLGQFGRTLASSGQFTPVISREEREARLWQWPYLLAMAIVLLTSEWVIRKRSGLV